MDMNEKRTIGSDRKRTGTIIAGIGAALFLLDLFGVLRVMFLAVVMVIVGLIVRFKGKQENEEPRTSTTPRASGGDSASSVVDRILEIAKAVGFTSGSFGADRLAKQRILQISKEAGGVVSPADVAVSSDLDPDRAKELLDDLVAGGHCEIRVRKNGDLVYTVPAFLSDEHRADLESL